MNKLAELAHEEGGAGIGSCEELSADGAPCARAGGAAAAQVCDHGGSHSTLAQQHAQKPAEPAASPAPLRSSVPSSVNVSESFPKVGFNPMVLSATW